MPRPASEEPPAGVTLTRGPLGGYVVKWKGRTIGWLHDNGDRWNAYLRAEKQGELGTPLGCFTQDEAVQRIAVAAGWTEKPSNRRG
jgi:hypothetical protein